MTRRAVKRRGVRAVPSRSDGPLLRCWLAGSMRTPADPGSAERSPRLRERSCSDTSYLGREIRANEGSLAS